MSSIMVTGLFGASLPALDDVVGPTRHSRMAGHVTTSRSLLIPINL